MGKEAEGVEERDGGEVQQGKRRFWLFEFHPYSEKENLLNWWLKHWAWYQGENHSTANKTLLIKPWQCNFTQCSVHIKISQQSKLFKMYLIQLRVDCSWISLFILVNDSLSSSARSPRSRSLPRLASIKSSCFSLCPPSRAPSSERSSLLCSSIMCVSRNHLVVVVSHLLSICKTWDTLG